MLSGARRARFDRAAADALPGQVREALDDLPPPVAAAGRGAWIGDEAAPFDLFAALPLAAVEQGDPDAAAVALHLHDDPASRGRAGYRRVWNGVLRLFTLLQFLPGAWWTTRVGVERSVYPEFAPAAGIAAGAEPASDPPAGEWQEAVGLAAPEVRALLGALSARGAPEPEVGFELADAGGAVLAQAELGWPAHEVAVLLPGQEADAAAFAAAGWQVLAAGADNLVEALGGVFADGGVQTESEGAR